MPAKKKAAGKSSASKKSAKSPGTPRQDEGSDGDSDLGKKCEDTSIAFQFQRYMDPEQNAKNAVFLNTAGQSLVPYNVEHHARHWLHKQCTPYDDFPETDELPLREEFSRLLPGSRPEEIAINHAASGHLSVIALNLKERWQAENQACERARKPIPNREILILEDCFTSNSYPWQMLVQEGLAQFVVIPYSDDWTSAILDAYSKRSGRIRLVALMQNLWTDGSWIDLELIIQKLLPTCILTLDLTQSLGVIPVSETLANRADAIVASTHKWLCGLYGLSLMYVNSRSERIVPRNISGHRNYLTPTDFHERNRVGCEGGKCLPFLVRHSTGEEDDDERPDERPPSPSTRLQQLLSSAKKRRVGVLADEARMSLQPHAGSSSAKATSPSAAAKPKQVIEANAKVEPIVTSEPVYQDMWKSGSGVRLDAGGRPGNPILTPTLVEALRLINTAWRPANIKKHCEGLMSQLKTELSDLNQEIRTKMLEKEGGQGLKRQSSSGGEPLSYLQVTWPKKHAPHIVGLQVVCITEERGRTDSAGTSTKKVLKVDNAKVHERLKRSNITTSLRSNNIRVAIYLYNTSMDLSRLVRCLKVYIFDACSIY